MRKKRQKAVYILSVSAIFLFIFSIWATASFLGIFDHTMNDTDTDIQTHETGEINTSLDISGNTSSGISQKYRDSETNGMFSIDGKYLYKSEKINGQFCLSRVDISSGERFPLITGYQCRNLVSSKKYIYCIVNTTNSKKEFCNKIARVSVKGDGIELFDSTESSKITSMVADQDNIYYTREYDKKIYKINYDGDIYSYIYEFPSSYDDPYLFSIHGGYIYFTDGKETACIDLTNYEKTSVSYQICSRLQNPVLEDDKIFAFKNLSKSEIFYIDIRDGTTKDIKIGEFGYDSSTDKIDNISYYKNNVFISAGSSVYYYNIAKNNGGIVKDISSPSGVIYFNNDNIICEDGEFGINNSSLIKWLFAK